MFGDVVDVTGASGDEDAYSKIEARHVTRDVAAKKIRGLIGNSRLLLVTAEDVVSCQSAMVRAGGILRSVDAMNELSDRSSSCDRGQPDLNLTDRRRRIAD
jgi:hypothetical protein